MKFEYTEVWGFVHALRGMRNPMNSWDKGDSRASVYTNAAHPMSSFNKKKYNVCRYIGYNAEYIDIGKNDMKLAQSLLKAGNEHAKFMRMIHVAVDTDMPRYWWSEADTYHFGIKNSCSTMHKLLNNDNPITLDMFVTCEEDTDWWIDTVAKLERLRIEYKTMQKTSKDTEKMNRLLVRAKRILPEGFLQMRTWDTNYAELRNMYFQRKNHRLKEEWIDTFCKWVESLPYAKELIMYEGE